MAHIKYWKLQQDNIRPVPIVNGIVHMEGEFTHAEWEAIKKLRKWRQRIKCFFGAHAPPRMFLKRINQRHLIMVRPSCNKITGNRLMSKQESKDIRLISRKFAKLPLHG